jgi:para-nitrobenzyl esterase
MRISSIAGGLMAALVLAAVGARAEPVKVQGGLVEGATEAGVRVFKGIPFAAPPVGELRWKAPQPARAWTGVKAATAFAPICQQFQSPNSPIGVPVMPASEDCLYLNIWTPAKSAGEKLPVMVWIYGGGFTAGGTQIPLYSGETLAKRGVIVVQVAYRVGPFGFLAHPELAKESGGHGSGTYGLMDQIAGLQWVRDNIAAFGGDPKRVTIFGESAGGISVSMLALSPKAKGLFQGAISESGGSFGGARPGNEGGLTIPTEKAAETQGVAFLAKVGAKSVAEGRKVPADALVKAAGPALAGFWPAMDGNVLPGDAYTAYLAGRFNDTPILVGTNADEGALFVAQASPGAFQAQVKAAYGAKADAVLAAYPPGKSDAEALRSARDLMRDSSFGWHTWTWARLQSRKGQGKAFVYYFTHVPPHADVPLFKGAGATHADEMAYVFGHLPANAGPADKALSDVIQGYWTNFAKAGDPNGAGLPVWPRFTESKPQYMQLDDKPAPIPAANLAKLQALDGYYAWRRGQP